MAVRQQVLHSVEYRLLKNLKEVIINFEPHNVTGIFGVNGCGKSTILHSLLCIYKPSDQDLNREDHKFSYFFTPNTHTRWDGSFFKISHSFRQEAHQSLGVIREYSKTSDRWKPRYENRPERDVYFISIKTCVPEIEIEKSKTHITLTTVALNDNLSNAVIHNAAYVLNKRYQELNQHDYVAKRKIYLGVKCDEIFYSSLSMGAGEQRVFKILDTVYRAKKHSLIVIDEIDLLLHTDSLIRLLEVLIARANEKDLQIIFTSHREELTKRTDINIRHLHQTENRTICFNHSTPDCISRLTGSRISSLEIFVEDELSEIIVEKVVEELNIRRHCSIKRFGAIDNSFSLAAGLFLKGETLENICIVLDGDKYKSVQDRLTQIAKFLTGSEQHAVQNRGVAVTAFKQFVIPDRFTPEQFINSSIRLISDNSEVVEAARSIHAVNDKHEYLNTLIVKLGYHDKSKGLSKVVDKLASTEEWNSYTSEIREWLTNRINILHLN